MKCSICKQQIPVINGWGQGNNAQPVNDGRCCDRCNANVVIPARLRGLAIEVELNEPEVE